MIDEKQFEAEFAREVDASAAAMQTLRALAPQLARASAVVARCLLGGNKILTCGNGGSAGDASHLATEIVVRFQDDRPPYPAISLCDSGSTLTAASNDYGFDRAFERQVRALGQRGDVLVAFSTSGNSHSVVNAIHAAKELGLTTIAFLGKGGGACRAKSDIELLVAADRTARVQECHLVLYHALCTLIDPALKAGRK
ncbi:MAG: SIS domain-containing protein [Anaerolineae bacterium]|nr:SIS domain-containing protein [Phycisphaerae bacterium]